MSLGRKLSLCRHPASCQHKIFTVTNRRLPAWGLLSVWHLRKEAAGIHRACPSVSDQIPQQLLLGWSKSWRTLGREAKAQLTTGDKSCICTGAASDPVAAGNLLLCWQKRDGLVQEWCQSSKHPQNHGCAKKGGRGAKRNGKHKI